MLLNKYWWVRWATAGVAAGLSLSAILLGAANAQFTAMRDVNATLKLQNDELKSGLAAEKERLERDEKRFLSIRAETQALTSELAQKQDALALSETARKASEATLARVQQQIVSLGKSSGPAGNELAEAATKLDNERQRANKLESDLQVARADVSAAIQRAKIAQCSAIVETVTRTHPKPGERLSDWITATMELYAPLSDFSAQGDRTNRRATELGLSSGETAIGAIAIPYDKPIIFTSNAVKFLQNGKMTEITYDALKNADIVVAERKLQLGRDHYWNLANSDFTPWHARILVVQLQQLLRACDTST
ncbi:hypothetical protein [Tahibacter amnicola]|uniref:Chromosome partition protein Smc n=1 Tax=Tahibacter amnicola TaxID=2976241 RepID=A0ABY6B6R9_9GAMM|nr:hypothetical protein [Tahibacter amnicola]UXI65798.1 hypothetical protein N4264_13595 [Tahibacter amnicola]